MKKSITGVLTLLAGACAVHAQGTVSLANYLALSSYINVSYKATAAGLGGSSTGPTPTLQNFASEVGNGNNWTVALYGAAGAGDASSTLLPLGISSTFANGVSDGVAGTWYTGVSAAVPGTVEGGQATVQLYAWYNGGGVLTTYAAALAAGVPTGESATATIASLGGTPVGGGTPVVPASLPATLGNFTVTTSVPEPSTIALGVMGASAFLMRLRRKQ